MISDHIVIQMVVRSGIDWELRKQSDLLSDKFQFCRIAEIHPVDFVTGTLAIGSIQNKHK